MTSDELKISVIIPLFNGARFIGETLDSLSTQTLPIHEVVVVDDGSTDSGPAIVELHAIRARLIRQANLGVAVARNRGAIAATGSHIAFLDQDDLWMPFRHARLQRWYETHDPLAVAVTTCTSFVCEDDVPMLERMNELLHRDAVRVPAATPTIEVLRAADQGGAPATVRQLERRELLGGPPSVTASVVANREIWLATGGCFPLVRSADDYVGLLAVSMVTPVFLVDEPSLAYRVHPSSTTMTTEWNLPLLAMIAAVRHGDRIVRAAEARDSVQVPPIRDRRGFFLSQLAGLASSGSSDSALDALSCVQLLATSPAEKTRVTGMIIRAWARRRASSVRQWVEGWIS